MNLRKFLPVVETTVVWLFLLQAIRILFSSLFGDIYDAVLGETAAIMVVGPDLLLIILAMLMPLLLNRFGGWTVARVAAVLVVIFARVIVSLYQPALQHYASILLLGAAAFYISSLLLHEPERLMTAFVAGLAGEQLLRASDFTYDPTLRTEGLPIVIGLGLIAGSISLFSTQERIPAAPDRPALSAGLALGAGIFVQISVLGLPNAVARWGDTSYAWVAPALLLVTMLPLVPAGRGLDWYLATLLWPMGGLLAIAIVLACLVLAALLGGPAGAVLLVIAQAVFLFSFAAAVGLARSKKGKNTLGLETALGFILLLLFSFAFAFTFTYPYTLPLFRGLGTPILLLGALIAIIPVRNTRIEPEFEPPYRSTAALGMVGVLTLTAVCAIIVRPDPVKAPDKEVLRVATYNIHYGYAADWVYNLEEIAKTIEENEIDVILLQEVDAGRVTSFSVDDALWLGQRLGMHAIYQPTLEKLSGIALLSKHPPEVSSGQWLTSGLEQAAVVHAKIKTPSGPLDVFGVWLGLEPDERATQLTEALAYIGSTNPAVLGGDFNATPDSPVYARLVQAGMVDPFLASGSDPLPTSPAADPTKRIDYIWLRGLPPRTAWVVDSIASDHRMVVVEVQLYP